MSPQQAAIPTFYGPVFNPWVHVNYKLPESDGRYLVFSNVNGVVIIAHWENGFWIEYGGEYTEYVSGVTHWMPLPEPPNQ